MRSFFWLALAVACISMDLGCAPRVRVKSNPGPHDQGIRYYRPKPYLLISNIADGVLNENGKPGRAVLDERYVDIQLQYLPDFEEEYAIDVRTGFGVADVAITLEDGWNLTSINQKLDSQTDENLKAAADLMGSVASAAGAPPQVPQMPGRKCPLRPGVFAKTAENAKSDVSAHGPQDGTVLPLTIGRRGFVIQ